MRDIFIVGSKGLPAQYGGYETFVAQLTAGQKSTDIKYHVTCREDKPVEDENRYFEYNGAECIRIHVPKIGPAQRIYYDVASLNFLIKLIKKREVKAPIFYILGCTIGPFMKHFVKAIHALGGQVFINPDGHEWMREKWSKPVRSYLKLCEQLMVKYADLVICDSINIEKYVQKTYGRYDPNTTYIAYGAIIQHSMLSDDDSTVQTWFQKNSIKINDYYLVVGRFVPENNYETMIREFMKSKSKKSLVIVTNVTHNKFYELLKQKTGFSNDSRVKFVGTVYDLQLLKKIREQAFAYIHGHSVGGTNPSLLEALASTKLNLLYDVNFNREVARDGALYWTKEPGDLSNLINSAEMLSSKDIGKYEEIATKQVSERYSWGKIVSEYEGIFQ